MTLFLISLLSLVIGFGCGFIHARTRMMKKWIKIQAHEEENARP